MKRIILAILAFSIQNTCLQGQKFYFRGYSAQEGLAHPFVYSIGQDIHGYLWLGTPEGLYIFNGLDFKYLNKNNGLADNFISQIYRDSKNRMWLGHQNGSVSVFSNNSFVKLNTNQEIHGTVTDITEDQTGKVWISVQNQGLLAVNENLKMKSIQVSVGEGQIVQLESISPTEFLAGTYESLYLLRFDTVNEAMKVTETFQEYPGSRVMEIITTSPDEFSVLSQRAGLIDLVRDSTAGFDLRIIDCNTVGHLDNVQGGILGAAGDLWLISLGEGMIQYRRNARHFFVRTAIINASLGLPSRNVKSIYEDMEGNTWLGMFGDGIYRYTDNDLNYIVAVQEERLAGPVNIASDPDRFLITSGNRLLEINQAADSVLRDYSLPVSGNIDNINCIYYSWEGQIWIGYEHAGLFVSNMESERFSDVYISQDILSNSINHITGGENYILVSTKRGLCRIDSGTGSVTWYNTDQGLPYNNIRQAYVDSEKRILISTLCKEIYYIDTNGKVSTLEGSGIDPFTSVVSITEDKEGIIWVATLGNGVWMIPENGESLNFTTNTGLVSDYCYSMVLTQNDEPVVSHQGGISHIDPETSHVVTRTQYDGLNPSTVFKPNSVRRDPAGQIWFGSSEGMLKYVPGVSDSDNIPPILTVTSLILNGDTLSPKGDKIRVRPGRYEIEVGYIGIYLKNPEKVYYQTKLEGYNVGWSEPTYQRKAVFSQVGHGEYTFKIKAFNEYEKVTELSSALAFSIKKPVYATAWFYLCLVLIIGSSFYITLRFRERYHRSIQERLLENLDEKTKEIIVKEEIIKERKKVEQILIDAKNRAELYEQLKTSFLQNISHEIRTPMNAIVGFSQLLKEDTLAKENRDEFIEAISENADSLLKLIDDILDLSKLETKQLTIKLEPCPVNNIINELESFFQQRIINEGRTGIELSAAFPTEEDVSVVADKVRLKQILDKLLDNALKFTETGKISFGYTLTDNNIIFYVEDTGPGLSAEKQKVIFDLFRKIEDDKVKLYGGTGLGLTLAKYLINLMGGDIDVVSKEGEGSRFYFNLPYVPGREF